MADCSVYLLLITCVCVQVLALPLAKTAHPQGPSADDKANGPHNTQDSHCGLKQDPGSCGEFQVQWYYDSERSSCYRFWFGGCDGNENRFDSEEVCKRTCSGYTAPVGGTGKMLTAVRDLLNILKKKSSHDANIIKNEESNGDELPEEHMNQEFIFSPQTGIHPYIESHKEEQYQFMEDPTSEEENKKRNYNPNTELWPGGVVPYRISSAFGEMDKKKIMEMMDKFAAHTCITWQPVTVSSTVHHLVIEDGDRCSSEIGNTESTSQTQGYQTLTLSKLRCMDSSTILHELGHALGMQHELSRPDRNDHITINFDVITGAEANPDLQKLEKMDMYHTPFDQISVMMHPPSALSRVQGEPAFKSHDSIIGELSKSKRLHPSFYDFQLLVRAYNCAGHCKPKRCAYGGFQNKDCECYCPKGLTGEHCDQHEEDGGGHIVITSVGESVVVTSPGYPNQYPTFGIYRWVVEGPENSKLQVTIEDLDLPTSGSTDAHCYHWLEVRYNLFGQPGPEFCGDIGWMVQTFESADYAGANAMMLTLNTVFSTSTRGYRGFRVVFTSIPGNDATKAINWCEDAPCQHGGSCEQNVNNYWCVCTDEFSGRNCEIDSAEHPESDLSSDTVFHCDTSGAGECHDFHLGSAWMLVDGHFRIKDNQPSTADLHIPYTMDVENQQYCLHFSLTRQGTSDDQVSCSHLNFILHIEMEYYGFKFAATQRLLHDESCTKGVASKSVSFTTQYKVTQMVLQAYNIRGQYPDLDISDIRLDKASCE